MQACRAVNNVVRQWKQPASSQRHNYLCNITVTLTSAKMMTSLAIDRDNVLVLCFSFYERRHLMKAKNAHELQCKVK